MSRYSSIHETYNKHMKDYDKNRESLYLKYWDVNNLYGMVMSQNLPGDGFKWVENTSLITISEKTAMTIVMKDIFVKLMLNYHLTRKNES